MKTQFMLVLTLAPLVVLCQDKPQTIITDSLPAAKIFRLGEVTITTTKSHEMSDRLSSANMDAHNRMEVSRALNMLPGISLTASGPRNESMISVRGFDLRQVPVYMDGIPVYVPYDGYVDLARFTTFDLAAIDVSKGFSSVLYGPNSLGGAINLISRRPAEQFEFDGSVGIINTNGYRGNLNVGGHFGKFYVQGGYSHLHRASYRMSAQFKPHKNEDGNERNNSSRTDKKYNLKIGWTPNEKQEYVLGYIHQQGEKDVPVYCGSDTLNPLSRNPRYWQWPSWDKETYYFLSGTKLNDKHYVKTRLYYDMFRNSLHSYDDASFSTQSRPYAFRSFYNDYTYGGSVEYGTTILPRNDLKLALHYKDDIHRENNQGEPVRHFDDHTLAIGLEDAVKLANNLMAVAGVSYHTRKNRRAEDFNSATETIFDFPAAATSEAYNGQTGLFYTIKEHHRISATYARKTRFATIKDRYSYRMGTAIPNPDLKPETAGNYELSYTGLFFEKLRLHTAFFYSSITDAIMNISNAAPGKSQMRNAGKARYMGMEAQVNYQIRNNLAAGANYTLIERRNITNPDIRFTDVPRAKVFGFVQYRPVQAVSLVANAEYNSSRYSTSYGTKVEGFMLVNTTVSAAIWKYASVEAGINNVFDKHYSLVEGFPEEGRNFFLTLRFFNHD